MTGLFVAAMLLFCVLCTAFPLFSLVACIILTIAAPPVGSLLLLGFLFVWSVRSALERVLMSFSDEPRRRHTDGR